jgi:hypothetical protein
MNFQGIQKMKTLFAAMAIGVVLAGCSAGGKSSDSSTTTNPTTASSLNVAVDKSTINDTGSDTATITITALDSNNNVVASVPVTVKADSGVLTPSGTSTGTTGVLTATLVPGGDHTDRTINVVVTSGSISKTVSIAVSGAVLTAAVSSTTAGASATIQYTLVDASSVAIAAAPITVSLPGQADVAGTTDANGKYTFSYTMPSASTTVTATAAGVTTTSTVTPQGGTTVVPTAGTVTSPSLAANPSTVATSGQVELRALFIGANNAPIPNVRVRFQMVDSNSIGGTLSSDSTDGVTHNVIYSDANGVANTTYTAGTRGGVITAKACWDVNDFANTACPNAVTASSITVVATGVSVAVLTNGQLSEDDTKNIYSINLVVQVVDASNQPITGSTVTGSVDIPRFYRGFYTINSGSWTPAIYSNNTLATLITGTSARQSCDNEDINRNNVMESGEDANDSGSLEPFKASVTITPTSAGSDLTDSFGKAYFTLQYGQNYASWEDAILTFTTSVEGTEGHATYPTSLPVPAATLTLTTADPPFKVSPYNVSLDGKSAWIVGTTAVANPGVIYPAVSTFNLCQPQQ